MKPPTTKQSTFNLSNHYAIPAKAASDHRIRNERRTKPAGLQGTNGTETYLAGLGEAAVEVVLVGPVLEVADPERADLLQGRRLVVRPGHHHRAATAAGGSEARRREGGVWSGAGLASVSVVLAFRV